jgi:phosphatidate cytidylyltransferase
VGVPIAIALVWLGGVYIKLGIAVIALIGMYEFYRAVSGGIKSIHWVGFLGCALYVAFAGVAGVPYTLFGSCALLAILALLLLTRSNVTINDCALTVFGFLYVCFLFTNVYHVRQMQPYGLYFSWLVFVTSWITDTGAYAFGRMFGKHKLIPKLSPNKTVEGAIGGVASSAFVCACYGYVVARFFSYNVPPFEALARFAVVGVVGSVAAQVGDLVASSIKRKTGIKDFGTVMFGHGGVLDRFDSVLFTAPVVYFLAKFWL